MRELPEQELGPERELGPEPEPGRMEGLGLVVELPLEAVGKKQPPEEGPGPTPTPISGPGPGPGPGRTNITTLYVTVVS